MNNSIIIGLTGTNASGKGTVAEILKKRGFSYYSLSDVIRDDLKLNGLLPTRENLIKRGNELRKEGGPAILAIRIKRKLNNPLAVIDSIRNTYEVKELKNLNNFYLIAVDAPIHLRYSRALKRKRFENATSLEEFKAIEEKEKSKNAYKQQIDQCIQMADHKIINDGTVKELEKKLDEILSK